MRVEQLALQLYTLRHDCARDFHGTLRQVAAIGYRAVELAGLHGERPEAVRATLDELGLKAASAHVNLDRFEGDFAGVVAELRTLGCEYAVVPWVPEARRDPEAMTHMVAAFHRWAAALQEVGIGFAYHNHDFELRGAPGVTMWDLLVAASDPALIGFELDVYWAYRAHHDPVEVLGRAVGRIPLVHLKDVGPDGTSDAPAGAGSLDWAAILPAAAAAGAKWYIVEQDHPRHPLDDVRQAFELMSARQF